MKLSNIKPANSVPDDFNVIIEIPTNSDAVKYEVNKDAEMLEVDRFMPTSMHYPCNYGFIPNTLADDGDPADVLVLTPFPVVHGSLMRCRAVAVLHMEDESGMDNKILALPIDKLCLEYAHIKTVADISPSLLKTIVHFFETYKGLEPNKWVKVTGWGDLVAATKEIEESISRYQS